MSVAHADALVTASSNLQTGCLEEESDPIDGKFRADFDNFAAIASELLGATEMCWDVLFSQVGDRRGGPTLDNIVLISAERLYIAQRSSPDEHTCHLGIASRSQSLGFALAQTRSKEPKP